MTWRAGRRGRAREAVLVYAREIAFSAAQVYARTAEARGAWDARRGPGRRLARARRGPPGAELLGVRAELVLLPRLGDRRGGRGDDAEPVIDELRAAARRARLDLLAGVQGAG